MKYELLETFDLRQVLGEDPNGMAYSQDERGIPQARSLLLVRRATRQRNLSEGLREGTQM